MKKRTVRSLNLKKTSIANFSNRESIKGGNLSNGTLCDTCEANCVPDSAVPSCDSCFSDCRCGGTGTTGTSLGATDCS